MLRPLFLIAALLGSTAARAQDDGGTLSASDLPPPSFEIQRLPPTVSYEFGMHFSFGTVTYWREFVDAWIGFGGRFAAGKHLGDHRIGGSLTGVIEGPFPVHTSAAFEPHLTWDWISTGGLQLGAGVGPAVMYHWRSDTVVPERRTTLNPSVAMRVGWSQSWTRVGRRLFLVAEPKLRWVDGQPNPLVALVVGSGNGR